MYYIDKKVVRRLLATVYRVIMELSPNVCFIYWFLGNKHIIRIKFDMWLKHKQRNPVVVDSVIMKDLWTNTVVLKGRWTKNLFYIFFIQCFKWEADLPPPSRPGFLLLFKNDRSEVANTRIASCRIYSLCLRYILSPIFCNVSLCFHLSVADASIYSNWYFFN